MERWYYFIRNGDNIVPMKPERLPARPHDANQDHGDPFTPWYETTDHIDSEHIHIRAASDSEAAALAKLMLRMEEVEALRDGQPPIPSPSA